MPRGEVKGGKGEVVFHRYTGHFETEDGVVFAVCDQLPLATFGDSEKAALAAMDKSLDEYREMMRARGEWELALKTFKIETIRVPLAPPAAFGWTRKPSFAPRPFERMVPDKPMPMS